jgi:nucleoside-diphosphate-sugar epimerase
MSKYLVTGGAGFIGTNLVKQLLSDGHEVMVLDNYSGGRKIDRIQSGVQYIEGDVRNPADLDKACVGVDGIFHMAALPRVSFSVENPELTHDVNVNGTLQVLMAAKRNRVKRLVFSSSSSTYGAQEKREAFREDTAIKKPISPYALHKLIGEHYCRIFFELFNLETVSLIYFNVYGPYFDPDGAYALVVGRFLKQKKNGEPMTVCGDGEYYRDYTHVKDVVRANILAMQGEMVGHGETINIGNNNPHSVNDLVKLIGGESIFVPPRAGDGRYFEADITKAKKLLNWEPSIKLEDGIKQLKSEWDID